MSNAEHGLDNTIYVAQECDSVCAFIFLTAARRYFTQESKIGVHSRDIEDSSSMRLTLRHARILAKRGVPESAIGKMVTTRPSEITYLDAADLLALDASVGNPFR
jgi:hypothetical protein